MGFNSGFKGLTRYNYMHYVQVTQIVIDKVMVNYVNMVQILRAKFSEFNTT